MKKKTKISIICIVIIIMLTIVALAVYKYWDSNIRYKDYLSMQAVIVSAGNELWIMEINKKDIYRVGVEKEGNAHFEEGQEIKVYYKDIEEIYLPKELTDVKEIKIVKKKSNIEIPDDVTRRCFNSSDKIKLSIVELTDSGIRIDIEDTNKLPYEYSHEYTLSKEVEEPVIYRYSEPNSTPIEYEGMSKRLKTMDKLSDISSEETEIKVPNTNQESSMQVRKFDWTKIYGKLEPRKISI